MTDLTAENARLRAALEQIANIVHEGGLLGMSESDALNAVRRKTISYWPALATPAPDAVQEAARVLLAACPNPLFDRLKPIIMGEVTESIEYMDEDGDKRSYKRHVSWTAMKEIIALALRTIAGDRT